MTRSTKYKGYLIQIIKTPSSEFDWYVYNDENDMYAIESNYSGSEEIAMGDAKRFVDSKHTGGIIEEQAGSI